MEPWAIRPQTGGNVALTDVVGRGELIADALGRLRAGTNLLVCDPRRMGKTAMLSRLVSEPGEGLEAVMISFEGVASEAQFLERTIAALRSRTGLWPRIWKHVRAFVDEVEGTIGNFTVKAAFADRAPAEVLGDVLAAVEGQLDDPLVVVMDEVPLAIRNITREQGANSADRVLQALRRTRSSSTKLRWVVCGSIGFHHVLAAAGSTEGAVNDLHALALGPLDRDGAGLLARCLALGIDRDISGDAVEAMVADTGGIPYLLHHVANKLTHGTGPISAGEVDQRWGEFVDDGDLSKGMTHLLTRIDDYPPELIDAAKAFLDAAAVAAATEPAVCVSLGREDRRRLIKLVVDDHYVVVDRSAALEFRWRYDVLRRIWVRRRYLPLSD